MKNQKTTRKKKKKLLSVFLAATVTFTVALAGTYAWRSVSQQALNESKGSLNPGARLHDDFNGMNLSSTQTSDNTERKVKYVYVENFTDTEKQTSVYARIRLDEYLEMGVGAGKSSNDATKSAQSLVAGATMENKSTWTPYKWDNDQTFRKYVTLSTGGDTVYMPTFNKDQDSLEADINGTLAGLDKNIETDTDDYSDYVKYIYDATGANTSKVADIEIYDAEGDGLDKVKEAGLDVETIVAAVKDSTTGKFNVTPGTNSITIDGMSYTVTKMEPESITASDEITAIYVDLDPTTTGVTPQADIILKTAEHTAQMTLTTDNTHSQAATPGIVSMADWNKLPASDKVGKYWVYDSEGWLYWAEPIAPSTATGCLLNGIAINDTTTEGKNLQSTEFYYGLNVVAQFASAGDWGDEADKTGFYKDGLTSEGEELLDTISAAENEEKAYRVELELQDEEQTVSPGSQVALNVKVRKLQTGDEETDATKVSWSIDWAASQSVEEKSGRAVTVHPTSIDENGVLTIAENETAETLVVVATYNYDTTNAKKTVEGRITINVDGELTYPITINPTATTEATKGESIQFTATVNKQIANGTPGATTDGTTTWSVVDAETGNALSGTTTAIDQNGTLTIDLAETAKALKIIATYTVEYKDESGASQGKKQWTAEKTITLKDCSYTMADITKTGKAEPGTTIEYKTSVTRTNGSTAIGNAINSGNGSGITWTLDGSPTDKATTIDPQTGVLTIGTNEKNANLTVKASFKDPLNPNADGSANIEKTTTVGTILTTKYTIEKTAQDYSAALVQGDDVTYTVKVKKDNGTDAGNYVSDPAVKWSLSGNKTSTTKADVTATDATEKKQKLTIGADETGTVKLTASYTGASDLVLHNAAIAKQTYKITLTGGSTNIVQEDTGSAYTVTVTKNNGKNAGAKVALTSTSLIWNVETPGKPDTKMTGHTYGTGTATAKLTVAATESASSVKVSASYIDVNNGNAKTTSGEFTVTIEASKYEIASFSVGATKLKPGESTVVTLTVNKTNGTGAPKQVANGANASGVTWSYSGNKLSGTQVTGGKLVIASGETGTSVTITPTYKAANGKTATTTGKTVTIESKTTEQTTVANTSVGQTVTIGTDQFYKVYDDGTKSLLWAVKTDTGFYGTAFGSNQQWTSSNARSYLNGTYVSNHSKIGEMIKAGIIPQTTIYTRTSPSNATLISTNDYIFLLSEADLDGQIYYYNSSSDYGYKTPDSKEYTAGTKLTGIMTAMRKDSSVSYNSWLRSPSYDTNSVALLFCNSGSVGSFDCTYTDLGVRPAFWVNH